MSESNCNSSLLLNMSKACVSGVCDGGDEYGDMCGEEKKKNVGKCCQPEDREVKKKWENYIFLC